MRVLHIMNDVTDRGNGIVNAAVDLALEQAQQGFVVAVASAGGGYQALLESGGVTHLTLDQARTPLRIIRALFKFHRQVREFRPDVVHAHMHTGLLVAWFWRPIDQFKLVGHVHNVHDRESVLMGLADRVIAVSSSVSITMAKSRVAAGKLRVVLNRTLGSRRQPALAEVDAAVLLRPAIVTVCGMTRRKGIEELISAFEIVGREFPDAHLYLVGDGPERQLFEEQARCSPQHDRIHFEGFKKVPQAYMLSADVFVLASRRESFGLVLIEARAAGCAIVATDVDGIAEALDGGRSGVLVPRLSTLALAEALCAMLGSNPERDKWRMRARIGIENYSVSIMAREVTEVYEELLDERKWRAVSGATLGTHH